MKNPLNSFLTILCAMILFPVLILAQVPTVDGLFYGNNDVANYNYVGTAPDGRGAYYAKLDGTTLYIAVVPDTSVNDNVFDENTGSDTYVGTAGWNQHHTAKALISSDNVMMTLTTGCGTWEWTQGYVFFDDNDEPTNMSAWDWGSGPDDGSIGDWGTLGSSGNGWRLTASASSFEWNMENSTWDVTIGGTRAIGSGGNVGSDWKSPDSDLDDDVLDEGYPTWDAVTSWEWHMVYEMSLDLSGCDLSALEIAFNPVHNSPDKGGGNIIIEDIYDWGDLPEGQGGAPTYPTLDINSGPSHLLNPGGPFLGSIVDADADGMPSETANGDDVSDGNDDEDGVKFQALDPTGAGTATFEVTAGTNGVLNAWIDWNGDGDFGDLNEVIASEMALTVGTHTLVVSTIFEPVENMYHRWRFTATTGQATLPTGEAPNGEVEDYMSTDIPLPVELGSFTAEATAQGVLCAWTTESEVENLGFMLERKTQGNNWVEIASYKTDGDLLGQGTTSSYTDYEYLDAMVQVGSSYEYRLADVDYNGVVTYHSVRTVTVDQTPVNSAIEEFTVLPAYPNPFNPSTSIAYAIPKDGMVNVTIYDLMGKKVSSLVSTEQKAGWHNVNWYGNDENGTQVPAGVYLLSINTGNSLKTMKLLLIK